MMVKPRDLYKRRKELNLPVKKIIEHVGLGRQTLYDYENEEKNVKPSADKYKRLLEILQLEEVGNNIIKTDNSLLPSTTDGEVYPVRYAPVLDYVQAGNFTSLSSIDTSELEQIVLPPHADYDPSKDFILKVSGDSMLNKTHKKCLYPGEYLIVDSKKQYSIGDVVVAYIEGLNEATVKLLTGEIGNMYLEPLNERYLARNNFVIPKDCQVTIKGVVKAVIPPMREF